MAVSEAAHERIRAYRDEQQRPVASHGQRNGQDPVMFPTDVVARALAPYVMEHGAGGICFRAGIEERSLYRILNVREDGTRESQHVSLRVLDDIVTLGLGKPELFHEDDGLAAIYEEVKW